MELWRSGAFLVLLDHAIIQSLKDVCIILIQWFWWFWNDLESRACFATSTAHVYSIHVPKSSFRAEYPAVCPLCTKPMSYHSVTNKVLKSSTKHGRNLMGCRTLLKHTMLWAWILWYPILGYSIFPCNSADASSEVFWVRSLLCASDIQAQSPGDGSKWLEIGPKLGSQPSKWPNFWTL